MKRCHIPLAAGLLLLTLAGSPVRAGGRELRTVEAAADAVEALAAIPLKGIPPALLQDAKGVAVLPHVVKVGFLLDGRFGRGVVLVRQPDGTWGHPVFVTLAGGGVGWQAGVEAADVVLVFKTRGGLDRIVRGKGKLTLGGDVGVAVGPVGRQAGVATDGLLKAEIYSYSRSRGLFVGVSLEGAGLVVDAAADEAFYGVRGIRPADILALCGVRLPEAVQRLQGELAKLSPPPAPPVIVAPPPPVPHQPPPSRR
jgi:lipid-binding SYLF domain-containing protein